MRRIMPASLCARRKYFVIGATFVLAAFYAIFVLRSRWLLKDLDSASAQLEMDIADTRPLFCDNPFQSFTRFDDADLSDCAFIGEQRMPTSSAGSNEMACRKLCIDEARAARRHGKSPCAMITFRRKGAICELYSAEKGRCARVRSEGVDTLELKLPCR